LSKHEKNPDVVTECLKADTENAIQWFLINFMQANPDKFQGLILGPKKLTGKIHLTAGSKIVQSETCVKLLGIHIDSKLNFDQHVTEICQKAARQLNALARLSRCLDENSKMMILKTFLLSNFNYCSTIWNFCTEKNTKKIEKLQERGLRHVYYDFTSTYDDMLERAQLKTLKLGRIRAIQCETFKILHKLGPIYNHNLFEYKQTPYNTRGISNVLIPKVRTTSYGKKSLRFYGAKLWNMLPNCIKQIDDFRDFKQQISTWNPPS
jgi:hypothetical protein